MATLEQFRQLENNSEKLSELGSQYIIDQKTATAKIIQMAADKGFVLTSEEIVQFINQMNENDEFDDLELNHEALEIVSGGFGFGSRWIPAADTGGGDNDPTLMRSPTPEGGGLFDMGGPLDRKVNPAVGGTGKYRNI